MKKINKFLTKDIKTEEVKHSNALGKVARGVTKRGMSIEERRKLIHKRRIVGAYKDSELGRRQLHRGNLIVGARKPQKDDRQEKSAGRVATGKPQKSDVTNKKDKNKTLERRHHFVEPPKRNFSRFK